MTLQEKIERIKALQRQIVGDLDFLKTLLQDEEALAYCREELDKDALDSDVSSIVFFSEDLQYLAENLPQI